MKVHSSVLIVINRYIENSRQKHMLVVRHFGRLSRPSLLVPSHVPEEG